MHPDHSTRRFRPLLVFRAVLLMAATGTFGACDQHSAEEVPENYGHGSSHERSVPGHQIDSSYPSKSFSDTAGTKDEQAGEAHVKPADAATPAPSGHFY